MAFLHLDSCQIKYRVYLFNTCGVSVLFWMILPTSIFFAQTNSWSWLTIPLTKHWLSLVEMLPPLQLKFAGHWAKHSHARNRGTIASCIPWPCCVAKKDAYPSCCPTSTDRPDTSYGCRSEVIWKTAEWLHNVSCFGSLACAGDHTEWVESQGWRAAALSWQGMSFLS